MKNDKDLLTRLEDHKPIIVNYGKGFLSDKEIKEESVWDDSKKAYISQTGTWDINLLIEIALGNIEGVSIECTQ